MGSFNMSGCISNIPIYWGDEIVCFFVIDKTVDMENSGLAYNRGQYYYPTDRICPLLPPFRTKYYDYGQIEPEKFKDVDYKDLVKAATGKSFEEFYKFSYQNYNSRKGENSVSWTPEELQTLRENFCVFMRHGIEDIRVVYEHAWYYDTLCNTTCDVDYHFLSLRTGSVDVLSKMFNTVEVKDNYDVILRDSDVPVKIHIEFDKNSEKYTEVYITNEITNIKGEAIHVENIGQVLESWNRMMRIMNINTNTKECSKIRELLYDTYIQGHARVGATDKIIKRINDIDTLEQIKSEYKTIIDEEYAKIDTSSISNIIHKNVILLDAYEVLYNSNEETSLDELKKSLRRFVYLFTLKASLAHHDKYFEHVTTLGFLNEGSGLLFEDKYKDMCVNFYRCLYNMSGNGLFFGLSNYTSQSIDYNLLHELSKKTTEFLLEKKEESEEGYDEE